MRRESRNLHDLEPCPMCGKYGGERKESVNTIGRYYVRCRCCGYMTSSRVGTNNAARVWNQQSRAKKGGYP